MQKRDLMTSTDELLELPLAKAPQSHKSSVVRLGPDVTAIDSNAVFVPACRGEQHSRQNADAFEQGSSMQLQAIDSRRQLDP
jgi:hypothetical protein